MKPEIKEKLIGKMAFSTDAEVKYVPEIYKDDEIPEEYRFTVYVKPLSTKQKNEYKNISYNEKANIQEIDKKSNAFLHDNIVNFENFYDLSTEEQIEFEKDENGKLKRSIFEKIPEQVKADIFEFVLKISGFGVVEKKQ